MKNCKLQSLFFLLAFLSSFTLANASFKDFQNYYTKNSYESSELFAFESDLECVGVWREWSATGKGYDRFKKLSKSLEEVFNESRELPSRFRTEISCDKQGNFQYLIKFVKKISGFSRGRTHEFYYYFCGFNN